MLPVVLGLPMILMKHLDRSEDVKMLKGTKVTVHSIDLHPAAERDARNEKEYVLKHPAVCLYVMKSGAQWRIHPDAPLGLYPIKPCSAMWYLDKGRPHPKLVIHRTADCAAHLCVEPERDDIRCRGTASCWRGI